MRPVEGNSAEHVRSGIKNNKGGFMKNIVSLFMVLICVLLINADSMDFTFHFNDFDFSVSRGEFDRIICKGNSSFTFSAGSPDLPVFTKTYILPAGYRADSIVYQYVNEHIFANSIDLMPVQKKVPISKPGDMHFTSQDDNIYKSNASFPLENAFLGHQGLMFGNSLCNVHICPFRYNPVSGDLLVAETVIVNVFISPSKSASTAYMPSDISVPIISNMVDNPHSVNKYLNRTSHKSGSDSVDYYIITDSDFDTVFSRLAQWKTKKGIRAMTVTTDYIYSNYSGYDNAEQIRNFIKDMNSTEGAIYFLLAGQADYENSQEIIPRRNVYYITCGAGYYSDEDTIISDLYYADLDGSWNADGDNVWGESTDSVDLYGDVFVGRAPVRTVLQAQTFVNKIITYEKNPDTAYINTLILPAAILWTSYYGDTLYQNRIADMAYTDWTVEKMYERRSELTHNGFVQAMSQGVMMGHWVGHGNEGGIYTYYADAFLNNTDADTLSNMPAIGIVNSIGCMCGAMDYVSGGDCFAEKLVINDGGGVLASIMNSRFGWGNPPGIGPSEEIDSLFYHHFFIDSIYNLGMLHSYSKNGFVSNVSWTDVWAWCIYELNLFGDPELNIYTDIPARINASHPSVASFGSADMVFTITDSLTGNPINNARVCIMNDSSYAVGITDPSGYLMISTDISSSDSLDITVTAHNYLPYEARILVSAENPHKPSIVSMPECIRINTLSPIISASTIDDENDDIVYRLYWDTDKAFSSPDSISSSQTASGDTVSITITGIENNTVYYYRVRASDPGGSGYWSSYSNIRSFTADTAMGNQNCSFYQCNDYQFALNTMNGARVNNNSITLNADTNVFYDTLFIENFESGSIANGWSVVDVNNDSRTWAIASGEPLDLNGSPPNAGSYFVYYSDDDAGSSNANAEERLLSPVIDISSYDNLELHFSYAFRNYQGEYLYVEVQAYNGSWTVDTVATITSTAYTNMSVSLDNMLPADSIRIVFIYDDNGHWGWAAGVDNVSIRRKHYYSQSCGQFFTKTFTFNELNSIYPRPAWGYMSWLEASIADSVLMRIEYFNNGSWEYVPDSDLPGNSIGFSTSSKEGAVSISSLSPSVYDSLRIEGFLYCDSTDIVNKPAITGIELGNLTDVLSGLQTVRMPIDKIHSQYSLSIKGPMPNTYMPEIQYSIPLDARISIALYDISGRQIAQLYNGMQSAGTHIIRNRNIIKHAGIYFIYLQTEDFIKSERILIVR